MGVIICVLCRNLLYGFINGPLRGIILQVQDCSVNESVAAMLRIIKSNIDTAMN